MLSISKIINSKESRPKWRFTKYYTGVEKTPEEKDMHLKMELEDEKECAARPADIKTLSDLVCQWVQDHIGMDFKFREYQFEYIVQILHNILNSNIKITCLEAPTGSGKSWIAFIVAGVAWEYYRKSSYILVSDLGLLEQYINDVNKYKLDDFAKMKGLANYRCSLNNMVFPSGDCKLHKVPYNILMNQRLAEQNGYYCTPDCPCIIDRKKAILSPITIMTYVLYLCHMNDVKPLYSEDGSDGLPPFDTRDIVICDEVHKMPDIVQNWCSPEFSEDYDMGELGKLIDFINSEGLFEPDEREECTTEHLVEYQHKIVDFIYDKPTAFSYYMKYFQIQDAIASKIDKIRDIFEKKEFSGGKLSKDDKAVLFACSWLENRHTRFATYPKIVENIGYQNLVINSVYDNKTKSFNHKKFCINCVYEEWLVNEFFNNKSKHEVMMTATVGDYGLFQREIGVGLWEYNRQFNDFKYLRIPTTFNYKISPIYMIPDYKMSYAYKDQNLPHVVEIIDLILQSHKNQKGIIHTGSYEFARKLFDNASIETKNRLLCYSNSKEKEYVLDEYNYCTDKVLAGPTLVEGIDLPDDNCRFMIVMKVPYPSLADQLVRAKKDVIPFWYDGETMKTIVQSLGRGIRHKDDWCITYIVDGSFENIYDKMEGRISPEIYERFKKVTK